MEAIALINRKGGNGKTSTVSAAASGMTGRGRRVLVIDLDGQGSITHVMRADPAAPTILDVMTGSASLKDAIQHTEAGDIVAANPALDMADMRLNKKGREFLLQKALKKVTGDYDLVLMDTLPAFGVLTLNALACASGVIIPTQADVLSLNALKQTYGLIQSAKEAVNPRLEILGILITRYSRRSVLNRDLADAFKEAAAQMGTRLFAARIREGVAVKEAQAQQQDIFSYAPRSNPAKDYNAFLDELAALLDERGDGRHG